MNYDIEIWKNIEHYKGIYLISSFGRVKSFNKYIDGIIMKNSTDNNGYQIICLSNKNSKKTNKIHQLVASAFIPNPENKLEVNHINGIKKDNNVRNLEWVTSKENRRHALDTGLAICANGERCGKSKLTEFQVLDIRKKYLSTKTSLSKLGIEYGVSAKAIHYIINRTNWKHI